MPITITKPKPVKALPKVETDHNNPGTLSDEQLADAYGSLQDQINALEVSPLYAQFAEIQKELADRIKSKAEATDTLAIKGSHWLLEIGVAAKNPRKLFADAIPKIQKFLGAETFAKIAKVNISDCEKYLVPEQVSKVIDEDVGYSDKRKIVAKFLG